MTEVVETDGYLARWVGANLQACRRGRGLSQEECARLLGVHRVYVAKVEAGARNLTLRTVERLAQRLGSDPADLLRDPFG